MSEIGNFIDVFKGSKSDAIILITTFVLTVLIDLTVAIEIGMILAAFMFMRNMMQISSVHQSVFLADNISDYDYNSELPEGVEVFEINGPLFFGVAYKFKDAIKIITKPAKVLVIRMRNVPIIDATGIRILRDVNKEIRMKGTKLILSEVTSLQVINELKKTRLLFQIGKGNITNTFEKALLRANEILLNNINQ